MNIKAVNSAMNIASCQPIRNQSFSKSMPPNYSIYDNDNDDIFTPTDPCSQEKKFDLACRMLALNEIEMQKVIAENKMLRLNLYG